MTSFEVGSINYTALMILKVCVVLFVDEDYERKGAEDSGERSMQGLRWDSAGVRKVMYL